MRAFSTEEITALQLINCLANALAENVPKLHRRTSGGLDKRLMAVRDEIIAVLSEIMGACEDMDQVDGLWLRMRQMVASVGYVHKKPEEVVILKRSDACLLMAPCLDRCDLECPCVTVDEETGERTVDRVAVKGCETRKALRRAGVKEAGLSMECPYSMV